MIEYPSADDYVKAVQHPECNFSSAELKTAHFPVHPLLGIPMPASGSSAVVFKAVVGGVEQALRFFTRHDVSSRERYNALNQHFETRGIADCVATSRWCDDAIVVRGRTWPVVRMQWVNGRTLDQYIEGLVEDDNAPGIGALVTAWRNLVGRLQRAEFAHGDLQHGNVLIDASGSLRLVDFDCSWIAPLAGKSPPTESGHRNYQHPGRTWGQWMDTFPGLVIYTSLLALSKETGLWEALHDGENLIFRLEDFDPPYHTDVWKRLSNVGDGELDALANRLKECCAGGWSPSGALEALLQPRWWEQTRQVQSPPATAPDRPQWWQPEPSASAPVLPGQPASLPLPQRPPPAQTGPSARPLPAPKKITVSPALSIPVPRPPSKTHSWPHAPGISTGSNHPSQGSWWGHLPATPPGYLPPTPSQPTPAPKNRPTHKVVAGSVASRSGTVTSSAARKLGGRSRAEIAFIAVIVALIAIIVIIIAVKMNMSSPGAEVPTVEIPTIQSIPATQIYQAPPEVQLQRQRDEDNARVEQLVEYWVPQLSAKKLGLSVHGTVFSISDVLADHKSLRSRYPAALLLWSGDYSNYDANDFWITVVGQPYSSADEANAWCDSEGIGKDDCFANRLSHSSGSQGSYKYR